MTIATSSGKSQQNFSRLSPHLVCDGAADAIEFYQRAFGATEMMRLPGENGKLIHASVSICGASVMLVDESEEYSMLGPKKLGGTPVTLHLNVDDVDTFVDVAEKAGAKVVMPVADMFWGDRYGLIEDPFGHRWSVATTQRELTPEEMQEAMKNAMPDCGKS